MVAIAVTRNGKGEFWRFENRSEADLHPLVQYGDAILDGSLDILSNYTLRELPEFFDRAGLEPTRLEDLQRAAGGLERKMRAGLENLAEDAWARLLERATEPPTDSSEICKLVREDRIATLNTSRKETTMTDTAAAPADTKKKGGRTPKASKFGDEAVITLGSDKEGKKYGPDNNPKRGKAADRFAKYADGMTVKQAKEAGVTGGDVEWDADHNYISVAG